MPSLAWGPPADMIPLPCIPGAAGTWGHGAGRAQDQPAAGENGGTQRNEHCVAKSRATVAETNAEYPVLEQEGKFSGSVHGSVIVSLGRSPERSPALARTGFEGGS